MSLTESIVEGTLKPDGSLELDQKPNLSPGRVTVILRQEVPATTQEGWWPCMQNIRKQMEEAGCHFMDEKEMQAHIDWLREEDQYDVMLRGRREQVQKAQ